jgi:hypothetical protein
MGKENVEFYSDIKKNEIILFSRKWLELEIIILHKISQSHKDKCQMFSLHMEIRVRKRYDSKRTIRDVQE